MARLIKKGFVISLGVIFFLVISPIRLAHYFYERVFLHSSRHSIGLAEVFAETFYSIQEAVSTLLPAAKSIREETKVLGEEQKNRIAEKAQITFDPELDKEYRVYIGESDGSVIGYAMEDAVKGKWGNIRYMVGLDLSGKVTDVLVLELKERRGRPVKERRFLDQFMGKTAQDTIRLKKDIKGVAGATISSRGMTDGIRKVVSVFNELYKK